MIAEKDIIILNNKSRTQNAIYTAFSSGFRVILNVIMTFVSRTLFIYLLGAEYLSLNGLFTNVLSVLSLADLGIGSAIVFFLYKPLAADNKEKIVAFMSFYKKCYRMIGLLILILGFSLLPFLNSLVNFQTEIKINLYLVYILFLTNTAATYLLFAYKQCLLQANQKGYILENINSVFAILNSVSDFIILLVWKNYILYLIFRLLLVLLKNIIIGYYTDINFKDLKGICPEKIGQEEKRNFFKSLYDISIFNIGDRLINSTDNIIISAFLGTILIGYYSNYYMIVIQLRTAYSAIMKSFQAGIGNIIATNAANKYQIYKRLSFINHFLGTLCSVELFQVFNSFIYIWIGKYNNNYLLGQEIVAIIALNFYYDNSTWILNMFREANGDFHVGRYISLITGIINIFLSIMLAKKLGLFGVLLATIICKYSIAVFPFVFGIGNKSLDGKGLLMVKQYCTHFIVTIICMIITWFACGFLHLNGHIAGFITESILCCLIVCIIFFALYRKSDEYKFLLNKVIGMFKNFKTKR